MLKISFMSHTNIHTRPTHRATKSILKVMYQMCQRKAKWKEGKQQKKSWDEGEKMRKLSLTLIHHHIMKANRGRKKTSFVWLINVTLCEEFYILSATLRKKFVLSSLFYELNNCIKIYIGHIICAIYIHQHIYEDDNQNKKCHWWHWGISSHSFSGSTRWVSCHVQ